MEFARYSPAPAEVAERLAKDHAEKIAAGNK